MRWPFTPHGTPEIVILGLCFGGAAVLGICVVGGVLGGVLALAGLGLLGFVFNFFRDPERKAEGGPEALISPADGTVTDVLELPAESFVGEPCLRVGIFLSVFDVHVNRTPLAGTVQHLAHRPGAFLDARDPACSDRNEAMDLGLVVNFPSGQRRVLVRQIAGAIARRIICPGPVGRVLRQGERYGMIKFGSRTEVFVPRSLVAEVLVKPGDKVQGGRHVLARLKECPA
jgi:phosphatidylserine decarboxylase